MAKGGGKGKKILIVEDEELLSDLYREVFEKEGFRVTVSKSAQEALHAAETEKPDFILQLGIPYSQDFETRKGYPTMLLKMQSDN